MTRQQPTSALDTEGPRARTSAPASHDDYAPMLEAVRVHFGAVTATPHPLFTTAVSPDELWSSFLGALPGEERQQHTCHECRRFIQTYGGLVAINDHGQTVSVMWGDAPGIYAKPFRRLRKTVEAAVVTGVFLPTIATWGTPETPDPKHACTWRHLAVKAPKAMVYVSNTKSSEQRMAEYREEYGMLSRGLGEYGATVVARALDIARMDALYRGEKVLGHLEWLDLLHGRRAAVPGSRRANLVWRAIVNAPAGWCHVKTSVVSTLLDDLAAGVPLETAQKKFAEKLNPTKYMRPVAPPKAGTVAQAEKAIEALQAAGSLKRRYARLDEMHTLWVPATARVTPAKGVFGHLIATPNSAPPGTLKGGRITWEKFAREVLPNACALEAMTPSSGNYIALVTAEDPSAPPILQWDNEDNRNPVSWYVYATGSPARQWMQVPGMWAPVTAVVPMPFEWPGTVNHGNHGKGGVVLTLAGCRDTAHRGNAIFPETLRSELHGVRSVIEAYSRRASLGGLSQATACGLSIRAGSDYETRVRVTTASGMKAEYTIDRWD